MLKKDIDTTLVRVELADPDEVGLVDPRGIDDIELVELCKIVVELPDDIEDWVSDEDRLESGCDGPADGKLPPLLTTANVVLVVVGFGAEVLDRENVADGVKPTPVLEADTKPLEDVVKLDIGVVGFELRSVFEYIRIALVPPQFSDGEFLQGYVAALVVATLFAMVLPQ